MITTIDLNEVKLLKVTSNHVIVKIGCHTTILPRSNDLKKCVFCGGDFKPKRRDTKVCDRCKPKYYAARTLFKRLCQERNEVSADEHGLRFSRGLPTYLIRRDGTMKSSYWYLYQLLTGE